MSSKSPKPVKECEGCALNRGDHCLVFEHPAEKWLRRNCEGFNNEELIAKYGQPNDGQGAHARKAARQKDAKNNQEVEHPEDHTKFKKIKFP